MNRSLRAVLVGTFTLRFSTGLTGAMLGFYLATLPDYGGVAVTAATVGLLHATFYLAELVLSPAFGILSDRIGHHRVMLYGPVFGAVAVVITALTTNLPILGGTRLLEGASTAASIPSILGYIAMRTAGNELLRGRMVARFEGATLAGLGVGYAVAPILFDWLGPVAFFVNAGIYGVSFLIYWRGVEDPPGERATLTAPHFGWRHYRGLLSSAHIWLLAPTWIAVNASIGLWFSQSIFQFAQTHPDFPDQVLMQGFSPAEISLGVIGFGVIVGAGLFYWGERFRSLHRATIIGYGLGGGAVLVLAMFVVNHGDRLPGVASIGALMVGAGGLFVLAGATPAALGLLADISERFPADRGAIMGLYSVFLALGQIAGALVGGVAADWRGVDGLLVATLGLLGLAVIPLTRLRRFEHWVVGPGGPATLDTEKTAGP